MITAQPSTGPESEIPALPAATSWRARRPICRRDAGPGAEGPTVSTAPAAGLAAVLGALTGSFLTVVIWRLPRGESLWRPGSHCPGCGGDV
ncbi:MAG: prepilin peptidase, partial [Solirubrobacteraceae bacterium]